MPGSQVAAALLITTENRPSPSGVAVRVSPFTATWNAALPQSAVCTLMATSSLIRPLLPVVVTGLGVTVAWVMVQRGPGGGAPPPEPPPPPPPPAPGAPVALGTEPATRVVSTGRNEAGAAAPPPAPAPPPAAAGGPAGSPGAAWDGCRRVGRGRSPGHAVAGGDARRLDVELAVRRRARIVGGRQACGGGGGSETEDVGATPGPGQRNRGQHEQDRERQGGENDPPPTASSAQLQRRRDNRRRQI